MPVSTQNTSTEPRPRNVEMAPSRAVTRRPRGKLRRHLLAWLFLAPLLFVNGTVIAGPGVATVYYAFTDWSGLGDADFVGLENFTTLATDGAFLEALWHNVLWMAFFLTVPVTMGLVGAFLLSRITRFGVLFRVLYILPYTIASVVNAAIWKNILSPTQGVQAALTDLGVPGLEDLNFLGDPTLALPTVAFVDNWTFWGFVLVLFLAAMQSVDKELYEAARVDGASAWREFWHVTVPGVRPTLVFVMLIIIVWSVKVFDYIYILTQGGPAGATEVVATRLYKEAFENNEAGYAAAMGLSTVLISGLFLFGYQWLRKRKDWNI